MQSSPATELWYEQPSSNVLVIYLREDVPSGELKNDFLFFISATGRTRRELTASRSAELSGTHMNLIGRLHLAFARSFSVGNGRLQLFVY